MTTAPENLIKVRKVYLDALNDPQSDAALLQQMLAEMQDRQPKLFVSYVVDGSCETINADKLHWSENYFTRQKKYAELNFSRKRLEHLIQLREHFRLQGRKGFVPNSSHAESFHLPAVTAVYSPSNNFRKFVDEGDVLAARTSLRVELNDNRLDSQTLHAALRWVKSSLPDLCEAYVEKAFAGGIDPDRNHWTKEYYNTQKVYLKTNFAEERFLHLIDVREYLRQQNVDENVTQRESGPKTASRQSSASAHTSQPQETHSTPHLSAPGLNPVLKTAMLVGGAIATVVILLLSWRKLP